MAPDVENTATAYKCKKVSLTPSFVPQTKIQVSQLGVTREQLKKFKSLIRTTRNPGAQVRGLLACTKKYDQDFLVIPVTIQWTHPSSRAVGPDGYPAGILPRDCHKNYSGTRIIRTSFGQILLPQSSRRDVWEKPSDPTARSRWGVH
jgi:hypothetical protein